MSFSLKPVSHSAAAAAASPGAAMPAAAGSAAAAGDSLFASLFAGQLGEGGQGQQADLGSLLGLPAAAPASLLAATPAARVAEQTLAAPPAATDAAMMMQMSGLLQPPATLPPQEQEKQVLPALGDTAQEQPDQPAQPDQALLAAQAGMAALPLAAPLAPASQPAAVADVDVLTQQAAQATLPLAAQAQLRPDTTLPKRDNLALPPAAASDAGKLLTDKGSQASVLPPAQTVAVLAQQTGQQSGFAARDDSPLQTVAVAAHGKTDILPADVRLMFRKEMQQAGLAQQAASTSALEAADMVAGQRQILPPGLTSAAPAMATQEWRIDTPMARTAEWQAAFGEKVSSMVTMKLDSASIQISPENLGPLDISIRFDAQEQATISVVAASPEAKSIVESGLPQLSRMLEQSGIQLGSTQVSTQQQAHQQAQQQAQEQARQQEGRQGHRQGHQAGREPVLPEAELARTGATTRQNGLSIHA